MVDMLATENAEFQSLLTSCKSLVRHFKHTGLQRKLKRTLKQECPTRWNSIFTMLESILSQYDEVHDILSKRKELKYLYAIDKEVLSQIVSFLEHFKVASEKACSDSHPTLHFVVPLYQQLLKMCVTEVDDIEPIKLLKARAKQALPQKVRLDVLHDVAVFLNPCMKGLNFLTSARKKAVLEKMRQFIGEVTSLQQEALAQNNNNTHIVADGEAAEHLVAGADDPNPRKKVKIDDFSDLCDPDEGIDRTSELSDYVNMKVSKDTDMMQFWRDNSKLLPNMFLVACRILCIPASSAASERVFSTAGRVLEKRRTNLSPNTVDSLLFLHSNM
jgi:hypothetical protein